MTQPATWTPEEGERLGAIARGECMHPFTIDVTVIGGMVEKVYCIDCRQEIVQ